MNAPQGKLHRLTAFAAAPGGGNPAGVWVGQSLPDASAMQRIAADVGFSETAFVAPVSGRTRSVRYFSPEAEVMFCGHATIAAGVVVARRDGLGRFDLHTRVGTVPVKISRKHGEIVVALESVEPACDSVANDDLQQVLKALNWQRGQLDPDLPPASAYAGAWHLVLAAKDRRTLAELDYDFDALKSIMQRKNWTTLQLVVRDESELFHARNPFPVGGIVEDPATGAAAAAFGAYLRSAALVDVPARITILQGYDMGRPSRLTVDIPASGGIVVSGTAFDL